MITVLKRKLASKSTVTRALLVLAVVFSWSPSPVPAAAALLQGDDAEVLSIEQFITLATGHDRVFDEILIDQLVLVYRKDLLLPPGDLVLAVKHQYNFYLSRNRDDPELSVALSKLFPIHGTEVSAGYRRDDSFSGGPSPSEIQLLVAQPIARNAFGHATRLLDRIIGLENDILRHQIIEAYEDYLASLVTIYLNWYSAHENLLIGATSYHENLKLLDNILDRQQHRIALPVDVNKVKLLVNGKEENLIHLQTAFANLTHSIRRATGHPLDAPLVPADPSLFYDFTIRFEDDYRKFTEQSRTYRTLDLLESKSTLEVEKNADDLLPSTRLLAGYALRGEDWGIQNSENLLFAGIALDWPFPDTPTKAAHALSEIELRKTRLSRRNIYLALQVSLLALYAEVEREQQLIRIADDKIALAGDILTAEIENYSFGKITLNDYIDAVNRLDDHKFNRIARTVQLKKLLVEWLRLTDQLVDESDLASRTP